MKKTVAIAVAVAILAAVAPSPARAGDSEWATAGKILTGVIGVTILGNAIASAYGPPPPPYVPRVYYSPPKVWVPGHYEARIERQWIPGHWEIEKNGRMYEADARYGRGDRGYGNRNVRRVWVSGHYREVRKQVWIPGHWEVRG